MKNCTSSPIGGIVVQLYTHVDDADSNTVLPVTTQLKGDRERARLTCGCLSSAAVDNTLDSAFTRDVFPEST